MARHLLASSSPPAGPPLLPFERFYAWATEAPPPKPDMKYPLRLQVCMHVYVVLASFVPLSHISTTPPPPQHTHTHTPHTRTHPKKLLRDLSLLASAECGLRPPSRLEERETVHDLFKVAFCFSVCFLVIFIYDRCHTR